MKIFAHIITIISISVLLFSGVFLPAGAHDVYRDEVFCGQHRTTPQAPESYYHKTNPLAANEENLLKGKQLFESEARPLACADCHGHTGNGRGPLAEELDPPPTNLACKDLMEHVPDGQLFWVIQEGSGLFAMTPGQIQERVRRPGRRAPRYTSMRGHKNYLTDKQIWQLVLYIRSFTASE